MGALGLTVDRTARSFEGFAYCMALNAFPMQHCVERAVKDNRLVSRLGSKTKVKMKPALVRLNAQSGRSAIEWRCHHCCPTTNIVGLAHMGITQGLYFH
jgi:hypothetical protein